ncbi:MAG: hypothetical protein ACJ75T_11200 [Solirubrobacterales bacterium]
MSTRRLTAVLGLALAVLAIAASSASATFHEVQVREVYPGSAAAPAAEYVELQAWANGQNHVGGHFVRTYDAAGNIVATSAFPADVSQGANQMTMVLATPEAESAFGVVADAPLSPSGQLSPAGGAVCWETIDCVAWGAFSGSLPSPAGSPAAPGGIPDGMALRRSIGANCATALDPTDDHDNSLVDFAAVFPAPRPNSIAPSEVSCTSAGGGGPTGSPYGPPAETPQTTLRRKPPKRTSDRTPTFRFATDATKAQFQCKVDKTAYRTCRSPFTTKRLGLGAHTFKVQAIDSSGRIDPSPASYRFRVVPKSG